MFAEINVQLYTQGCRYFGLLCASNKVLCSTKFHAFLFCSDIDKQQIFINNISNKKHKNLIVICVVFNR